MSALIAHNTTLSVRSGSVYLATLPLVLGFSTGISLLSDLPAFYFAGALATLFCLQRSSQPILWFVAWAACYQIGSGAWLLLAPDSLGLKILSLFALCFGGVVFYGCGSLVLFKRWGWAVWPFSIAFAEYVAAHLGFSLAPIGLGVVDTPVAYFIALGSIQFATAALLVVGLVIVTFRVPLALLLSAICIASVVLPGPIYPEAPTIRIVGVSHNPDAHTKWLSDRSLLVLNDLKDKTAQIDEADLIIWPENAVTTTFEVNEALTQIGRQRIPLLFGMTRYSEDGKQNFLNSAILLDEQAITISDKVLLAPVLEDGLSPFLSPAILPGQRSSFTLTSGETFLVLICYEAAFMIPHEDRFNIDFIVVISAETGFWAPMAQAIMGRHAKARSIETGLPVIRVSDSVL